MTFDEFKKQSGYREEPIVSFDRWILNMFDADRSGALSVKAEREAKEKYENTHNLQEEYAAYISGIEARNAQSLRQLLAQWEAQTKSEGGYVAQESDKTTRGEREQIAELEGEEKTKKMLIISAVVVVVLILFKK